MARLESVGNKNELLFLGFNQDNCCMACGTNAGFRVYNCEPFKEVCGPRLANGGIGYVEMLHRTNIRAVIGGGRNPCHSPNKVLIWDEHQARCVGELSFRTPVRAVKLRRDRIVVVLEFHVYVYHFADLTLLHHLSSTANPKGLCAISPDSSAFVLACPGTTKGSVRCELSGDGGRSTVIHAHTSALAALALNSDGRRVATTSDTGTLIRIFDTATGQHLQELRRGTDHAQIYCIAFDATTQWLAASSDKGTIHVFCVTRGKVNKSLPRTKSDSKSRAADITHTTTDEIKKATANRLQGPKQHNSAPSNPTSLFAFAQNVLPAYFSAERSFAQYRVPDTSQTIVAFAQEPNTLFVASADGLFYKAHFDPQKPNSSCVQAMYTQFVKDDDSRLV